MYLIPLRIGLILLYLRDKMQRYIGAKNGVIHIVSNSIFSNKDMDIIQVSSDFNTISSEELLLKYKVNNGIIELKKQLKKVKDLKIAFVSNYWMHCGLSTYAENLYPEIIKNIGDYRLFIEDNVVNKIKENDKNIQQDKVVICWKRNNSLKELIKQIKLFNPDIVLINHEWGLFPDTKYWLSFLTQISDYRVITTMHSIFPNHYDKVVVEASIPEIVVHLEEAKNCLINKKNISGKVYVIPHGCYENNKIGKLWNTYKSDHTFIQVGFGLRYKCFEDSIKAVALLKEKYKDIFFTAVFSESKQLSIEHDLYHKELVNLIYKLNVEDNVGIIRGFQSNVCLDSYFRTNRVAVFPYKSSGEHFVYGASGAARLAMSKNIPVITSSIPHFDDLNSIKADTPEQIAKELDLLFSDSKLEKQQIDRQNSYIEENAWEIVANKYIEIFKSFS